MRKISLPHALTVTLTSALTTLLAAATLTACSPKFDWRDYRSNDAPYAVLFPGKPASQTRTIDLDGQQVAMTMAAAEVDDVTFAIGSAELPDAAKAQAALLAMKTALVKNIGGTITFDKPAETKGGLTTLEIQAKGTQRGESMLLVGRFIARDKRIYQVIVMGREKNIVQDTVDTFLSSFKLN